MVTRLVDARTSTLRVNGGFFAFRKEIFDYIEPGEELVDAPFRRLIEKQQLMTYRVQRLLEGDGHLQGQAAAWTNCSARAIRRGRSGANGPAHG